MPGASGLSLHEVFFEFIRQVKKVGLVERAAAISFNLVMALPAAILFLFSIIPYLPDSSSFDTQIMGLFKDIAPNSNTYILIKNILNGLLVKHVGVFSFGFILLMYYSSNAVLGIIRTFDKSIFEKKVFFLHRRWRAIILTFILILLVIASTTLLVGHDQFATILKQLFHMKKKAKLEWWDATKWVILIVFLFYGIALVYKFAPSVKRRWPLITPGSILATVLILLTTILFSYWVNHFGRYNKVYGSIGTVLIIMLLLNLNSLILLIGFELNVSINKLKVDKEKRLQNAPLS
jgi:membrane protein